MTPPSFPGSSLSTNYNSLIQFYPNFEDQLRDSLRHLVGKKVEEAVEIGMARDGSGVGGKPISFSSLRRTILKPFISRFGCPHRHASSFNLICRSLKITTDPPRIGRLVRIQKRVLFKFVVPCCSVRFPFILFYYYQVFTSTSSICSVTSPLPWLTTGVWRNDGKARLSTSPSSLQFPKSADLRGWRILRKIRLCGHMSTDQ